MVHELKADFTRLNRRFADEEPDISSESTLSDKSLTITRDAVQLPHLKLPTFEGDPLQWKTFWEDFQSILGKVPHLTDADRLRHLRRAIKSKEVQATTSIDGDGYGDVVLRDTIDNAIATDYTFNSCSSTPSVSAMKTSTVP